MTLPLTLSSDESMLVDSARALFAQSAPVSAFRTLRAKGCALRYEPALLAELAANGFVAPNITEQNGGLGMGASAAGLIAEQAGRTLAAVPLISQAMAAALIERAGNDVQKELLAAIMAGTTVVAVGFDESARHDPQSMTTQALRVGDGWVVTGRKRSVMDGVGSHKLIVSAWVEGVPGLFLIDGNANGLAIKSTASVDSRNLADIMFDSVSAVQLGEGDAASAIQTALDLGRALLAAEMLGLSDEAFERTVHYLKEREQFGQKIGAFQALAHRAARLYARLDVGRSVVIKALRSIDGNEKDATMVASLAKGVMTRLARDVMVEAVQMHGGIGVTDDLDIGLFFKRARVAGELFGDDYFHIDRLGREHWKCGHMQNGIL